MSLPSPLCQMAKSMLPSQHSQITQLQFFLFGLLAKLDFMSLPSPLCQMAKFTLPTQHSLVTNSTSPRQECHIAKSTSPCGLPKWASSCPKIKKILDQCLNLYLVCPNFGPKLRLPLIFIFSRADQGPKLRLPIFFLFFHRLPRLTYHLSASFWLDGSLKLERSTLKLSRKGRKIGGRDRRVSEATCESFFWGAVWVFSGRSFDRPERNSSIGQPGKFYICGQLWSSFGQFTGWMDLTIWQCGPLVMRSWQLWEYKIENHGLNNWGKCEFFHLAKWT